MRLHYFTVCTVVSLYMQICVAVAQIGEFGNLSVRPRSVSGARRSQRCANGASVFVLQS